MTRTFAASRRGTLRLIVLAFAAALLTTAGAHSQARNIYSDTADAHADLSDALTRAAREHKRVILDFGGNWCGDCQVLDIYFHREPNAALLADNFILVDINIGHYDRNEDIADKYGVPIHKGVPALAVLDSHGQLLYSQRNGEFESMRRMDPNSVTDFLEHWKSGRN
jgi:thiol:disulfide interchange protein